MSSVTTPKIKGIKEKPQPVITLCLYTYGILFNVTFVKQSIEWKLFSTQYMIKHVTQRDKEKKSFNASQFKIQEANCRVICSTGTLYSYS